MQPEAIACSCPSHFLCCRCPTSTCAALPILLPVAQVSRQPFSRLRCAKVTVGKNIWWGLFFFPWCAKHASFALLDLQFASVPWHQCSCAAQSQRKVWRAWDQTCCVTHPRTARHLSSHGHRRLWVCLSVTVNFAQPIHVTLNCSISVHVCIFSIKDNLASHALAHKTKEYESPQNFLPQECMPDDCCAFHCV